MNLTKNHTHTQRDLSEKREEKNCTHFGFYCIHYNILNGIGVGKTRKIGVEIFRKKKKKKK